MWQHNMSTSKTDSDFFFILFTVMLNGAIHKNVLHRINFQIVLESSYAAASTLFKIHILMNSFFDKFYKYWCLPVISFRVLVDGDQSAVSHLKPDMKRKRNREVES